MAVERQAFENALREIKVTTGLDLTPDEAGAASVKFADGVVCNMEVPEDGSTIFFHSEITALRPDSINRIALLLLQANVFSLPVEGVWLAIEPVTDRALLCGTLPLRNVDADAIETMLAGHSQLVPQLREGLEKSLAEPDRSTVAYEKGEFSTSNPIRL